MRYNPKYIEYKWQRRWLEERTYEPDLRAKRPFYNLMMFPYPSAEGLHVGNMYAFTGADIYGRFKRMQGYDVFEPIGLDGFGIHSENYALKIGKHPAEQAKISEKNFYRQLQILGNGFAWDERLETYDPEYYKWTQWIFVQMFKRGLAYRKKAAVNWCESCKTVLADEQVVSSECERCGTRVVKRELEQWFFKITEYAERLLENLGKIDWSERVKIAQRNWIGRSEGSLIKFALSRTDADSVNADKRRQRKDESFYIEVFTTRPDTLFGATYMVVAPEHPLINSKFKIQKAKPQFKIQNWTEVERYIKKAKSKSEEERIAEGKGKTGVESKGIKAINPANGEEIPIFVADYVLGHVGTGAIMGVPGHDERDFDFAKKYKLPIRQVVEPPAVARSTYPRNAIDLAIGAKEEIRLEVECWIGGGRLVNSGKFSGMDSERAKWEITKFVGGQRKVQYRLRDWLISRQRYWGPPIPMIFCVACKEAGRGERKEMPGWWAVSEKDLPVKLPHIKEFRPTGTERSPLAGVEKFYKVRCPKCHAWARRETDVSDTFLDSAWYYLGYLAKENCKLQVLSSKFRSRAKRWLPVDMYIGGAEHAVLHLLYSRFIAMVFRDWGLTHFDEPFAKFRSHGLLIKDGAKMSKSRGNIVNPDDYIRAYGADTLRMYLMFLGPFEQGGDFRDTGIRGITRFLERVWWFILQPRASSPTKNFGGGQENQKPKALVVSRSSLSRAVHKAIKKVAEDIEGLQYNTAISALMMLLNEFEANKGAVTKEDLKIFLKLLAPFAPHITEELWQELAKSFIPHQKFWWGTREPKAKSGFISIHREPWPRYNPRLIQQDTFELVIQVNGKVRGRATLPIGASETEAKEAALAAGNVRAYVPAEPKKVIFVPNRLINFVV